MKQARRLLRVFIAVVAMMMFTAIPAFADEVNEEVKDARNGVMQVQLVHQDRDGNEVVVGGGSGFLINEDTIVTCYHVTHLEDNTENYAWAQQNVPSFDIKNVKVKVVVRNDVTLDAKLVVESEKSDFAVFEMEQAVGNRNILSLNVGDVSETQQVFALGFPDSVAMFQNQNAYTAIDVTISDGRVTKTNESDGVKYVQHSAKLSSGYSGGPLVNYEGEVIAINRGTVDENNYSVAIQELTNILDDLRIGYTPVSSSETDKDNEDETPEKVTSGENETQGNEIETTAPVVEKPTVAETEAEDESDSKGGIDKNTIIIIAAIAVVVIIIIIILIMSMGGKKKTPVQPRPQPQPQPQPRPQPQPQPQPQPYPYPQPRPQPQPPFFGGDGAGETTVLNEGAGETTVLGVGAGAGVGRTIIRTKNGERISITRPEFVIGKERRRVDYCISDNNSVSRTHAKLVNRGNDLFVIDLNATNGTFVNGSKIPANQEVRLSAGDRFKVADEEFQVM